MNIKTKLQPKGRQVDPTVLDAVRGLLGDGPRRADLLVEYLHLIQDRFGRITAPHLAALAAELNLSQAETFETATFYAHFLVTDDEAPALTLRICRGTPCEQAGAAEIASALKQLLGPDVRIIAQPCIGLCDQAPAAMAGQKRIGRITVERVQAALEQKDTAPSVPAYQDGGYGTLGKFDREAVVAAVEKSGLSGLGGAGFPAAKKWKFLEGSKRPPVLCVNADEGEPGTFKDRHLLETNPHRVLEGALIAAKVVGADDIYIYLRDEYPHIREILSRETASLSQSPLTDGVTLHLRRGAGAYVCGEETALIESLEGKRGLPRGRPPYPAQSGLFGRPTLVHNVETLYWVAEIADRGADWYRDEGRPRLWSVSGRVKKPGVYRAPSATPARELITLAGGMADGHELRAFFPGGMAGGILPAELAGLPLDFGTLEEYGCFVGSGALIVLSDHDDLRQAARSALRFFAEESCGQCTPCRVGCEKLTGMVDGWEENADTIADLARVMADASICGLGQSAANPLLSLIRFFPETGGKP